MTDTETDSDTDRQTARTKRIETAEQLAQWSFDRRGDTCRMVGNGTDRMTKVEVWTNEDLHVPEGVEVVDETTADGTAAAVANWGPVGKTEKNQRINGWRKLSLRLTAQEAEA